MRLTAFAVLVVSAIAFACAPASASDSTILHKSVQGAEASIPPMPIARPIVVAEAVTPVPATVSPVAAPTPIVVQTTAPVPTAAIGWGDIFAGVLSAIWATAGTALVALLYRWVPAIIRPILTEQLLTQALNYAFGAVEGAVKGQTVTIPIANEMLRHAVQYANDNGAPKLLKWIGDTLEPKLIARLSAQGALPATATIASLTSTE